MVEKINSDVNSPRKNDALILPLLMSKSCVSKVIGIKGATIAKLREQSGCNFSAESEVYKGEQIVNVVGNPEWLGSALSMMTPLVEEAGDSHEYASLDYNDDFGWAGAGMVKGGKGCGMSKGGGAKGPGGKGFGPSDGG